MLEAHLGRTVPKCRLRNRQGVSLHGIAEGLSEPLPCFSHLGFVGTLGFFFLGDGTAVNDFTRRLFPIEATLNLAYYQHYREAVGYHMVEVEIKPCLSLCRLIEFATIQLLCVYVHCPSKAGFHLVQRADSQQRHGLFHRREGSTFHCWNAFIIHYYV